ncbi:MAG: multifunctional CCA addition/repair protein [Burkholderiales bacterium]
MKVYTVGGAVRDELLGLPVKDRDFVVVGSTPEEMVRLGYKPVGKDFPVFLHAQTHEEYALARTERKTARGYKGFQVQAAPDVTLEDDLQRRDLSINAIAKDDNGRIIDPFGGVADLKAGILRHVSPAFVEDPVRVLRVARFTARFDFSIADETLALMREMAANGEIDALVPERVWQEFSTGLMENKPSRMFAALRRCGALMKVFPELDALFGVPQPPQHHPEIDTGVHVMMVIDYAAAQGYPLAVRFAALTHDLGKGTTPHDAWPRHPGHEQRSVDLVRTLCKRLRAPNECRDLALIVARHHGDAHRVLELHAATLLKLLKATDAFRKPGRFEEFLQACQSDYCGRTGYEDRPYLQAQYLRGALNAALSVDAGHIAREQAEAGAIAGKIHAARLSAVEAWLATTVVSKAAKA